MGAGVGGAGGTQFTCFTGTKVQILMQLRQAELGKRQFTCFTGTKVQMMTQLGQLELGKRGPYRRASIQAAVYLLYWYKSTNTDAAGAGGARQAGAISESEHSFTARCASDESVMSPWTAITGVCVCV